MARKYAVLQKKIEELESILTKVFSDSMETTLPYHQLLSEAINGKILFLKNLLSAETDSHPDKPHHLDHITQRLEFLETAFHDWDGSRSLPVDFPNTLRTCSCTSSCLNDNDNETLDPDSPLHNEEDPEPIFPFKFMDETSRTPEAVEEMPAAVAVLKKEEDKRDEKGWRSWVVKSNRMVTIAAALAMVVGVATAGFMRGGFYQRENVYFIPT